MRAYWLAVLLACVCAAAVIFHLRSAVAASGEARAATMRLGAVRADAGRLAELRASPAPIGERPRGGISSHVADCLTEAGVPVAVLRELAPEAERAEPGRAGLRRQNVRLTLEPMRLEELGRFLESWRQRHPRWTVASIQIGPAPGRWVGQPPLSARLVLEAIYLEPQRSGEPK